MKKSFQNEMKRQHTPSNANSIDSCGRSEGNDWINKIYREIPWPSFIHCSEPWFHRRIWKFIEKVAKSNIGEMPTYPNNSASIGFCTNVSIFTLVFFCRLFDFFVLIGQFYCESTIREMCEMASKRSHRRSKVSNVGVDKIFSILSIWIESSQPYWQNYRISICAIWIWDSFWPNTRKQQLNCRNLKLKVRNPIFLYIIWLNAMQFNSNVTFSVK